MRLLLTAATASPFFLPSLSHCWGAEVGYQATINHSTQGRAPCCPPHQLLPSEMLSHRAKSHLCIPWCLSQRWRMVDEEREMFLWGASPLGFDVPRRQPACPPHGSIIGGRFEHTHRREIWWGGGCVEALAHKRFRSLSRSWQWKSPMQTELVWAQEHQTCSGPARLIFHFFLTRALQAINSFPNVVGFYSFKCFCDLTALYTT